MKTIQTRRDAANAGETKYYTGSPCRNGHTAFRYTSTGHCSACVRERAGQFSAHIRTVAKNKLRGLVLVECYAYKEDVEKLREYALALRTSREISAMTLEA